MTVRWFGVDPQWSYDVKWNPWIAPGKSGNKNVSLRENYKDTKFSNESNFVTQSQILMFLF